jgi:hypothetical protein
MKLLFDLTVFRGYRFGCCLVNGDAILFDLVLELELMLEFAEPAVLGADYFRFSAGVDCLPGVIRGKAFLPIRELISTAIFLLGQPICQTPTPIFSLHYASPLPHMRPVYSPYYNSS